MMSYKRKTSGLLFSKFKSASVPKKINSGVKVLTRLPTTQIRTKSPKLAKLRTLRSEIIETK